MLMGRLLALITVLIKITTTLSVCMDISSAARPSYCKKACVRDDQCKKSKRCLCDGTCGFSCVNPTLTCHPLVDLENGFIRTPGDFIFDSNAEYGCDDGYLLVGPSQRRCQANREWSGTKPECRLLKRCGPPPEIPYAQNDGNSYSGQYELNDEVRYSCLPGYYMNNNNGMLIAKCLLNVSKAAQWFGPDFHCTERSCSDPGTIADGYRNGELFHYPHSVEFSCNPGFQMVGASIVQCLSNGNWSSPAPRCNPTKCPRPPDPLHGKVYGSSLTYGSRITYTCKDGYRLVGQMQRFCLAESIWNGNAPKCEEIICPSLPQLDNGYIEGNDRRFGALIVFRCFEGMTHIGAPYAKCEEGARWSHSLPKCLSGCKVPAIENGALVGYNPTQMAAHGRRLKINCSVKYEPTEPVDYVTCDNGTLTRIPTCTPVRCKRWPSRIAHAKVVFTKSMHGAFARYICDPGYKPSGLHSTIKCLFGEWSSESSSFSCVPILCEHPSKAYGQLESGYILLEGQMGAYNFAKYITKVEEGKLITFHCKKGHILLGSAKATCVNGSWKPIKKPKCVSQTHPVVEGMNNYARRRRSIEFATYDVYGNRIESQNGWNVQNWSNVSIKFRRNNVSKHCDTISVREYGKLFITKNEGNKIEATVRCRKGFRFNDDYSNGIVSCVDGKWSPEMPFCVPRQCRMPMKKNGYFIVANGTENQFLQSAEFLPHNAEARMICLQGYQLLGNGASECLHGRLVGNIGRCEPRDCFISEDMSFGEYNRKIRHGESSIVFCPNGSMTVNCSFGEIQTEFSCTQENHTKDPMDCIRPQGDQTFIAYQIRQSLRFRSVVQLSSFQSTFANNTILQYHCEGNASQTTAHSIQCINGEWITLLMPCVGKKEEKLFPDDARRGMCPYPRFGHTHQMVGIPGQHSNYSQYRFPDGTKLQMGCSVGYWTNADHLQEIHCVQSRWIIIKNIGCHPEADTCEYRVNTSRNIIAHSAETHQQIRFNQRFIDGAELLVSCAKMTMQQLRGRRSIRCQHGKWSSLVPVCVDLDPLNSDSAHGAPPIRFDVMRNAYMISPEGYLVANKSSTIRLSCFFPRDNGQPIWETSSVYRKYPQAWSKVKLNKFKKIDAFELTISMAQVADGGFFHCILPNRRRNTLKLIIKDMTCQKLTEVAHLHIYYTSLRLYIGTIAQFSCDEGFQIDGTSSSSCLMNGNWSHPLPKCQQLQCPPILAKDSALNAVTTTYDYGGVTAFYCQQLYTLNGPHQIRCGAGYKWSERTPFCEAINCPPPALPTNSIMPSTQKHSYIVREIVVFECKRGFMLTGKDYVQCKRDGKWTKAETQCTPFCEHPGKPEYGDSTSPARSYYSVGDRMVYYCTSNNKRLDSENVLECLPSGQWNRAVPKCIDVVPHCYTNGGSHRCTAHTNNCISNYIKHNICPVAVW